MVLAFRPSLGRAGSFLSNLLTSLPWTWISLLLSQEFLGSPEQPWICPTECVTTTGEVVSKGPELWQTRAVETWPRLSPNHLCNKVSLVTKCRRSLWSPD